MLDTIAHINILTEEAGITEVSVGDIQVAQNIHSGLAEPVELLCY